MANTADGKALISDTSGFNVVNAAGGEFTYQVPSQLGSVPGKIKIAYFSLTDSSGAQSTFNVAFAVEQAADMTQGNAEDWVSNLNNIKDVIESIDPSGKLLQEVIDARGNFAQLGDRENAQDNVSTQLSSEISKKVDENYVTKAVSKMIPGTPRGAYYNLAKLQEAFPNGTDGIYLTTINGHWYYYDGSWKDGGVYQAAGVGLDALNPENFNLPIRYGSIVSGLITVDIDNLKLTTTADVAVDTGRGYIYPNLALNQDIPASDGRPYTLYYRESTNEFKMLLTADAKRTTGDYIIIARIIGRQIIHNSIPRCLVLKNNVVDNPLVGIPSIIQGSITVDFVNKKINLNHPIVNINGNWYAYDKESEITFDKTTPAQNLVFNIVTNEIKLMPASPLYPANTIVLLCMYNNHIYGYLKNDNIKIIGEPVADSISTLSDISARLYAGEKTVIAAYGDSTDAQATSWAVQLEPILKSETGNANITVHKAGFGGKPLTWLNQYFYENFGKDGQFADTNFIFLGGVLNNGGDPTLMINYKTLLKSITDKATTLGMQVIVRTSQASAITRFTADMTPNYDRNQWQHYAFENKMRRDYAKSHNIPLLDFETATDLFQKYSRVPHSDLFEDRFHFDTRGSQFEAEWVASQILGRVITIDDEFIVNNTTQNIKSGVDWSYIKDVNPIDENGFKTTVKIDDNSANTLIYDSMVMNLSAKPLKLVACCDTPSTVTVKVNGTEYQINAKETVILPYAEIGLYHLEAYTGTGTTVDFKGFKFKR